MSCWETNSITLPEPAACEAVAVQGLESHGPRSPYSKWYVVGAPRGSTRPSSCAVVEVRIGEPTVSTSAGPVVVKQRHCYAEFPGW